MANAIRTMHSPRRGPVGWFARTAITLLLSVLGLNLGPWPTALVMRSVPNSQSVAHPSVLNTSRAELPRRSVIAIIAARRLSYARTASHVNHATLTLFTSQPAGLNVPDDVWPPLLTDNDVIPPSAVLPRLTVDDLYNASGTPAAMISTDGDRPWADLQLQAHLSNVTGQDALARTLASLKHRSSL